MIHRSLAWIMAGVCVVSLSISYPPHLRDEPKSAPSLALRARDKVDYSRDILPILSSKCFACHGPDRIARKAGLRLDERASATKPAKSKATPIVPGKPADSELVRRILAEDDERMPPMKGGKTLTDAEKRLLQRWIDEGAPYAIHWAFIRPAPSALPSVKNSAWIKNEIDAFILAKLESAGLQPNPRRSQRL